MSADLRTISPNPSPFQGNTARSRLSQKGRNRKPQRLRRRFPFQQPQQQADCLQGRRFGCCGPGFRVGEVARGFQLLDRRLPPVGHRDKDGGDIRPAVFQGVAA